MREYTSVEIQQISSDFRNVARRLLKTDVSQCDANLKRFMSLVENNELIMSYIMEKNTCIYDIPRVIKDRGWLNPFEISPVPSEEISFEYQLLKYAVEARNGDFTSLYGACYIRAKATFNDSAQDFIGHIIDPFVDYVADFLKKQYDQAVKAETANKPLAPGVVTASNSTLLFNSSVTGNVANQVTIGRDVQIVAESLIRQMEAELADGEGNTEITEIAELLTEIKEQIVQGQKPKKGVLTALKTICSGLSAIAPMAVKLWELFT